MDNKDIDFINSERRHWGKIYTDIAYAINEISPFLSEKDLNSRKYFSKASVLQQYTKLLDSAEADCKKKSFFSMFTSSPSISLLQDYKTKNMETFNQLEKCSSCECLSCSFECNFKKCSSCRKGSKIYSCDRKRVNVRKFDSYTIDLTNNETGRSSRYEVLAMVEDCSLDNLYILLENMNDSNDKLVLYYYPGIKEDSYGEITDPSEFDFIVETYQNS
ncbi:DUF1292 domain-containing protein [Clostridium saccharoperbutylacetonicum]|uniref:DUF1292 domain-containing protein n=1 Tax=Clostridium saccharoperbutylacetonicum TaxID=36745 RepID=UPI000983C24E|nr:DUF1292 domain-containing protein [Clostridium saccharoperbutylacetonicum]AQR97665.1 hypothetical protein CLSAP_49960 [Clostridium saccharoperbutylacetonicum]NSB33551.1 hypothetical protein [Clostridium saccharoperbutylacetonicum]